MKQLLHILHLLFLSEFYLQAQVSFVQDGTTLGTASGIGCSAGKFNKTNSGNTNGTLTTASSTNGALWSCNTINLNTSFKLTFNANFGSAVNAGDGIAFVMQTESAVPGVIGGRGGGIGYAQGDGTSCQGGGGSCPISPSVVVEFDTYNNYVAGALNDLPADGTIVPGTDHIAIHKNGSQSVTNTLSGPIAAKLNASSVPVTIKDGASHSICITWDVAITTMTVYFDGVLRLTYVGDIRTPFGASANAVYFGFTSATGSTAQTQSISSISMTTGLTSPTCAIVMGENFAELEVFQNQSLNRIDVSLNDATDFSSYKIVKKSPNSSNQVLYQISANELTENAFTFSDLNPFEQDKEVMYEVYGYTENTGDNLLALKVVADQSSSYYNIYPNPANKQLNVNIQSVKKAKTFISILDAYGRIITKNECSVMNGENEFLFDIEHLQNGVYFVMIENGQESKKLKFIKSNL